MHKFNAMPRRQILRRTQSEVYAFANRIDLPVDSMGSDKLKPEAKAKPSLNIANTSNGSESKLFKKPKVNIAKKLTKIRTQRLNVVNQETQVLEDDMLASPYFDDMAMHLNFYESLAGQIPFEGDSRSVSLLKALQERENLLIQWTKQMMLRYELMKMQFNATGFMDVSWSIAKKQQVAMREMEKELHFLKRHIEYLYTCQPNSDFNSVDMPSIQPFESYYQPSLRDNLFGVLKQVAQFTVYSKSTAFFEISKVFSWDLLNEIFKSNFKLQSAIFKHTLPKTTFASVNFQKNMKYYVRKAKRLIPKIVNGTLCYVDDQFKALSFRIELLQLIFNTGYFNKYGRTVLEDKRLMILDSTFEIMKERISKHKAPKLICNIALYDEANIPKCDDCTFCECLDKCLLMSTNFTKRCETVFYDYDYIDKIIIDEIYQEEEKWLNFEKQEAEVLKMALDQFKLEMEQKKNPKKH